MHVNNKEFQVVLEVLEDLVALWTKTHGNCIAGRPLINSAKALINKYKAHDFSWAKERLKAGGMVRRISWNNEWFHISGGNKIIGKDDNDDTTFALEIEDIEANDWVLYIKPEEEKL